MVRTVSLVTMAVGAHARKCGGRLATAALDLLAGPACALAIAEAVPFHANPETFAVLYPIPTALAFTEHRARTGEKNDCQNQ